MILFVSTSEVVGPQTFAAVFLTWILGLELSSPCLYHTHSLLTELRPQPPVWI